MTMTVATSSLRPTTRITRRSPPRLRACSSARIKSSVPDHHARQFFDLALDCRPATVQGPRSRNPLAEALACLGCLDSRGRPVKAPTRPIRRSLVSRLVEHSNCPRHDGPWVLQAGRDLRLRPCSPRPHASTPMSISNQAIRRARGNLSARLPLRQVPSRRDAHCSTTDEIYAYVDFGHFWCLTQGGVPDQGRETLGMDDQHERVLDRRGRLLRQAKQRRGRPARRYRSRSRGATPSAGLLQAYSTSPAATLVGDPFRHRTVTRAGECIDERLSEYRCRRVGSKHFCDGSGFCQPRQVAIRL